MSTIKFLIYSILSILLFFLGQVLGWVESQYEVNGFLFFYFEFNILVAIVLLILRVMGCIVLTLGYLVFKPILHLDADSFFMARTHLLAFKYFIWDKVYDYEDGSE